MIPVMVEQSIINLILMDPLSIIHNMRVKMSLKQ